jgi:hypothetical protein
MNKKELIEMHISDLRSLCERSDRQRDRIAELEDMLESRELDGDIIDGIDIGINDKNGIPLKCGDSVYVRFVNYPGSYTEYIDKEFSANIKYSSVNCAFMLVPITDDEESYLINHRAMEIEKI